MQNHKGFRRIICVTILCALLMVSMGRATRVSAVGTTAAIAGTAFILTGAVYLSYIALTNGQIAMPLADDMHEWLGSIGRKVSQYPSGAEAYQDIYQGLLRDPAANVIDGVWTWTQDRLRSFANDFSDTRLIQNILSYTQELDVNTQVTNKFVYPFDLTSVQYVRDGYTDNYYPISQFIANGHTTTFGTPIILPVYGSQSIYYCYSYVYSGETYRNVLHTDGLYGIQVLTNNGWVNSTSSIRTGLMIDDTIYGISSNNNYDVVYTRVSASNASVRYLTYPLFTQADTYIEETGEIVRADPVTDVEVVKTPQWLDPDNENRPIVPWVPIPDLPSSVPVPPGYTGPPQWGFPLAELLDLLESLAEGLMEIGAIGELINQFAGKHGDNYYLEYNDGDTNYYTYYQPTIFDNDTEYVTYNINISEQQDIIPVDLNTISLYTHNNYLDEVKDAARSFGSAIGEYVAFWHNCDPVVTYTILGSFVLILLGAFIGKWGHS